MPRRRVASKMPITAVTGSHGPPEPVSGAQQDPPVALLSLKLMTTQPLTPALVMAAAGVQPRDLGKQRSLHGDLGHLEGNIAAMPDELIADLD